MCDKRFEYRKDQSTSHAITLVDKVSKFLDKGKIVSGVYLGIHKAFDSISHQILLTKLHKIGIRGNIHSSVVACQRNVCPSVII